MQFDSEVEIYHRVSLQSIKCSHNMFFVSYSRIETRFVSKVTWCINKCIVRHCCATNDRYRFLLFLYLKCFRKECLRHQTFFMFISKKLLWFCLLCPGLCVANVIKSNKTHLHTRIWMSTNLFHRMRGLATTITNLLNSNWFSKGFAFMQFVIAIHCSLETWKGGDLLTKPEL